MLTRNVSLVAGVCLAAGMAAFGQVGPGTGILFLGPGATNSGSSRFVTYLNAPTNLNLLADKLGPAGGYQMLAKPDGTKFYVLGNSGPGALQSVDAAFTTFRLINGLSSAPTAMAITPDGKFLLAGSTDLNIVDTATDQIQGSAVAVPGSIVGIVIARDSTIAYVLSNAGFGTTAVSAYNLISRAKIGQLNLSGGGASGITVSPSTGLLYVTATARIFEIDPASLSVTIGGEIALAGDLGPLKLTADGSAGYLVNRTPSVGGSMLKFTPANKGISTWPPFPQTPPVFSDIIVAGNSRVFAIASNTNTLWDINPAPFGAAVSALGAVIPATAVLAAAVSNEVPDAQSLFVLTSGAQSTLYRVELATNTVGLQVISAFSTNTMVFAGVPQQGNAAGFYLLNNSQTIQPGATSQPYIVRVLDGTRKPVYNQPVTFTADTNTGITFNGATTRTTDADGYVQITVNAPAVPGTYLVNVTAGGATTTLTFTVPGTPPPGGGNPGGGGGTPSAQLKKASGDGQLLYDFTFSPFFSPITILVRDTAGNPAPNIPVTFTVTNGAGNVASPNTATGPDGLASSSFSVASPPQGFTFQTNIVTASTQFGSVDFYLTTYHLNQDQTGAPDFLVIKPNGNDGTVVTAAAGSLVSDAVVVLINSANLPTPIGTPIPYIGLRISDPGDASKPGPAACEGSSLSDRNGMAHCALRIGCTVGFYGMSIVVGETRAFPSFLKVTPGTAAKLQVTGGNNQSGKAGDLLATALTAEVDDGCGHPAANAKVTWSVVSGSGKLESIIDTSNANGVVSSRLRLGNAPGPVKAQVALADGTAVSFSVTNNVVVQGINLVGGGGQTVFVNQPYPNPVVFLIRDVNNNPIASADVLFTVTPANASLNPGTAKTNSSGQVSVQVTAGPTPGPVIVTASYAGFTGTATLTAQPPGPAITANSFYNAASFAAGLVPCGLATVIGPGIAPTISGTVSGVSAFGPFQLTVAGLSLTVNGLQAPIQSVSNVGGQQQATFQTPCEVAPGSATVVASVSGSTTTVNNVTVLAAQPGIFSFQGTNGKSYAAIISARDGSYVSQTNFLRRGETYYVILTGLGQTSPAASTNATGTGQAVNVPIVVGVNNAGVPVGRVQYLVGQIGVYFAEFTVPLTAPTGADQVFAVASLIGGNPSFGNSLFVAGVQ